MKSVIIYKFIAQLTVLILLTLASGVALACDDVKSDIETVKTHILAVQTEVVKKPQHHSTHNDCDCCDIRCCGVGCNCAYSTCSYVYVTSINDYFSFKISEYIVTQFSQYSFPSSPPLLRPPIF